MIDQQLTPLAAVDDDLPPPGILTSIETLWIDQPYVLANQKRVLERTPGSLRKTARLEWSVPSALSTVRSERCRAVLVADGALKAEPSKVLTMLLPRWRGKGSRKPINDLFGCYPPSGLRKDGRFRAKLRSASCWISLAAAQWRSAPLKISRRSRIEGISRP